MATRLWKSARAADWDTQWERYSAKDRLVALDAWFQNDFPVVLHARDPAPFLTQTELVQLMEWKLKKGKWRPQLMKFVESLSDAAVRAVSAKALSALSGGSSDDSLKTAVQALTELKGVGPATASAVLAAYDNKAPFMGDEALEAIAHVIGARKYTLAHYMTFAAQLAQKAAWLREQAASSTGDPDSDTWTAQRVQLCLYAAAHDRGDAVAETPAVTVAKPAATKSKAVQPKKQSDKPQQTRTRSSSRRNVDTSKQSSDGDDGDDGDEEEEVGAPLPRKRRRTSVSAPQQH